MSYKQTRAPEGTPEAAKKIEAAAAEQARKGAARAEAIARSQDRL